MRYLLCEGDHHRYYQPMDYEVDAWGRVSLDPDKLFDMAYRGFDIWSIPVSKITEQVERHNELCVKYNRDDFILAEPVKPEVTPEEEHRRRAANWLISDKIKEIAVRDFLLSMCTRQEETDRVNYEMDMFEERDLLPLLQLMIYIVDEMTTRNIVWGVGRGSSVASYCLFLIGVHRIDSIKYGLSIDEFLK